MEAKELRIGNYVSIVPHTESDTLQLNEKEFEQLYLFKNWDRINPIKLTEERLIKFGFEKRKDSCFKFGGYEHTISLHKNADKYRVEIVTQSIAYIEYVHQLQNLYFALTGEELELK